MESWFPERTRQRKNISLVSQLKFNGFCYSSEPLHHSDQIQPKQFSQPPSEPPPLELPEGLSRRFFSVHTECGETVYFVNPLSRPMFPTCISSHSFNFPTRSRFPKPPLYSSRFQIALRPPQVQHRKPIHLVCWGSSATAICCQRKLPRTCPFELPQ